MGIFKVIKDVFKAVDEGLDTFSKNIEEYSKKMEHENTIKKNATDSFFVHLDQEKDINTKYLNKEDNEIFAEEIRELSSECMIVYVNNYFHKYIDLGRDAYIEKIQQENPHIDTRELKNAIEEQHDKNISTYNLILTIQKQSKHNKLYISDISTSSLSDKAVYFSVVLYWYCNTFEEKFKYEDEFFSFGTSEKEGSFYLQRNKDKNEVINNLSLDYKNNYNHLSLDDYLKKLQEEGFIFHNEYLRKELMYI